MRRETKFGSPMENIVEKAVRLYTADVRGSKLSASEQESVIAWIAQLPARTSLISAAEAEIAKANLINECASQYKGQASPIALKFYVVTLKMKQLMPEQSGDSKGPSVADLVMSFHLEFVLLYVLRLCIPGQPVDVGKFKLCRNGQIAEL